MRAVVQRVTSASVTVDGNVVGQCSKGLCLLVAVHREDDSSKARKLAEKVLNLRIFSDDEGKMNLSISDLRASGVECGLLVVSNFTVYGDASKSRRPSFTASASYELGCELFKAFVTDLQSGGLPVATGVFGADMQVAINNDGPVTLIVEV